MTTADQARRVAEIAGYEVDHADLPGVHVKGQIMPFNPLGSANQAIEALSRVGPWNAETMPGHCLITIYGGVGIGAVDGRGSDPDSVKAFCAAAVAAILAAGGES